MTIKEIAKAFDLTVGDLAATMGYNRASLYGRMGYTARSREGLEILKEYSNALFDKDMAKLLAESQKRLSAIEAFEKKLKESAKR